MFACRREQLQLWGYYFSLLYYDGNNLYIFEKRWWVLYKPYISSLMFTCSVNSYSFEELFFILYNDGDSLHILVKRWWLLYKPYISSLMFTSRREQLQLWDTILLFCMMMGIACIYFRKDNICCTSLTLVV